MKEEKVKKELSEDVFLQLRECSYEVPADITSRLSKKLKFETGSREAFPESLRRFAQILPFYSAKAYRYYTFNYIKINIG